MVQGDKYPIPFTIKQGETFVTPNLVSGVKARFGQKTYEYPGGGLYWDSTTSRWYFELEQEETLNSSAAEFQAQVMFANGNIIGSLKKMVNIHPNIIRGLWEETENA